MIVSISEKIYHVLTIMQYIYAFRDDSAHSWEASRAQRGTAVTPLDEAQDKTGILLRWALS